MADVFIPNIYFVILYVLLYLVSTGSFILFIRRKWKPHRALIPVTVILSIFSITVLSIFLPELISIQTRNEWLMICLIMTILVVLVNTGILVIVKIIDRDGKD